MYVRTCHSCDEFRSSLHCVGRVDVLPQRLSNDDGCRLMYPAKIGHAMSNRSRCCDGGDHLGGNLRGMVQDGVEYQSLQVVFRGMLSREWAWVNLEQNDLERHGPWQLPQGWFRSSPL